MQESCQSGIFAASPQKNRLGSLGSRKELTPDANRNGRLFGREEAHTTPHSLSPPTVPQRRPTSPAQAHLLFRTTELVWQQDNAGLGIAGTAVSELLIKDLTVENKNPSPGVEGQLRTARSSQTGRSSKARRAEIFRQAQLAAPMQASCAKPLARGQVGLRSALLQKPDEHDPLQWLGVSKSSTDAGSPELPPT